MGCEDESGDVVRGRIDRLTEGQKDCLRLVHQHQTSKMIARALGISKPTVDQRIERAVRTMKAASRYEAALILAEAESDAVYDRIIYDPPPLAAPGTGADAASSSGHEVSRRLNDSMGAVAHPLAARSPLRSSWSDDTKGSKRNDLTMMQRIGWILCSAIAIVIATFFVFAAAESMQRTLSGLIK